jgi:putative membrane protein
LAGAKEVRMKNGLVPVIALMLVGLAVAPQNSAAPAGDHGRPLEQVLQEIRKAHGIPKGDRIDPDKLSEKELGEVGEAVMNVMVPDPREHEWMDRMMGGDDSQSLAAMHRMMGYRYLAGGAGAVMGPGGMMGPGMMGPGMMRGSSPWGTWRGGGDMMGYGYGSMGIWMIVAIVAAIVLLVALLLVVRSATSGGGAAAGPTTDSAVDILKKRYARGEITKEEFEAMKRDLGP